MYRIAYSSCFIPCKNKEELLTSWVVFAVNRYECFMENKNMIRTFCSCKTKKNNIEPHQNFTGSYKKMWRLWINSNINRISKRNNKVWNLWTRFIWEKKKHTIISEMSWCNFLRRAGKIHNIPHSYWRNTLSYNICYRVDIYKLVKRLDSSIC